MPLPRTSTTVMRWDLNRDMNATFIRCYIVFRKTFTSFKYITLFFKFLYYARKWIARIREFLSSTQNTLLKKSLRNIIERRAHFDVSDSMILWHSIRHISLVFDSIRYFFPLLLSKLGQLHSRIDDSFDSSQRGTPVLRRAELLFRNICITKCFIATPALVKGRKMKLCARSSRFRCLQHFTPRWHWTVCIRPRLNSAWKMHPAHTAIATGRN